MYFKLSLKSGQELEPFNSSQHWIGLWLGAVSQQAMIWGNIDQEPCRHMASVGSNELM